MKSFPFLVFKDENSLDYGMLVKEKPSYNGASRDITYTSIPGRSGDLIIDNGRYQNISAEYKMTILNKTELDFEQLAKRIREWLLSEYGYFKLWDSYDKNYYRLAAYEGEVNIDQELKDVGSISLKFNCKPFKYSFEGEKTTVITHTGKIYNPEKFASQPYFKIYGSGNITLFVNNEMYSFKDVQEYIEVDSEILTAYKGTNSLNNKMVGDGFPCFVPGVNTISTTGTVTKIEIVPRWCCI